MRIRNQRISSSTAPSASHHVHDDAAATFVEHMKQSLTSLLARQWWISSPLWLLSALPSKPEIPGSASRRPILNIWNNDIRYVTIVNLMKTKYVSLRYVDHRSQWRPEGEIDDIRCTTRRAN